MDSIAECQITVEAEEPAIDSSSLPDEEMGRAEIYQLLACLLSSPPSEEIIVSLAGLEADDTDLGKALGGVAAVAAKSDLKVLTDEYADLFLGIPAPRLMPYASYYVNDQLFGRALAELRIDLARIGIARRENVTEPEDHVATLCEIMTGMIVGAFGEAPRRLSRQATFFERHIRPWTGRFFSDLEAAEASRFYMAVAQLGRVFFALEEEAFKMVSAEASDATAAP
ncbi:TorD/DmsD family molecular chaperone [Roseibium aggregatum]|uniref:Molecular chaperone TorD n=1 Tax=Roseibium aggregatum TaxID=187304 RepID=A0A926SAL3_9HYPH|nr:molecular chaperone TorD family protein [Roseibium aggregatum]MBD1549429.1 molecular chaperone TorD [Roseibium aggregatum]